jgi:hypothetical protein
MIKKLPAKIVGYSKKYKYTKLPAQKVKRKFDITTRASKIADQNIRDTLGPDPLEFGTVKHQHGLILRQESIARRLAERKFIQNLPKELKKGRIVIARKLKSFDPNQRGKYRAVRSPDASQFLSIKDFQGTKKGSITNFYTPGGTPHPIRLNIFNIKNPKGIVTQRNVVAAPITKWKKPLLANEQMFVGFTGKYKIQSVNPKIRGSILLKQAKSKSALKRYKSVEKASDKIFTDITEKRSPFKHQTTDIKFIKSKRFKKGLPKGQTQRTMGWAPKDELTLGEKIAWAKRPENIYDVVRKDKKGNIWGINKVLVRGKKDPTTGIEYGAHWKEVKIKKLKKY